jgi:hypothetical protein
MKLDTLFSITNLCRAVGIACEAPFKRTLGSDTITLAFRGRPLGNNKDIVSDA